MAFLDGGPAVRFVERSMNLRKHSYRCRIENLARNLTKVIPEWILMIKLLSAGQPYTAKPLNGLWVKKM